MGEYDPCDPTTYPDSAAKGGSAGVRAKSGKSGAGTVEGEAADSNSVKARGKNKKADYAYDYDYDYDEAGKSGKSGNKSGKSGSPEDFECDLSCLPTLCPGPSPITLAPAPAP